jgi:adenylylsulfate kinase
MDTNARSIAKAISYRTLGSLSTALIVFFFSGDLKVSAGVGALDVVAKLGLYFVHERVWNYIGFGRQQQGAPEYEI